MNGACHTMFLESELYMMIPVCFAAIIITSALALTVFYRKTKCSAIRYFALQLASLCAAFYFFYQSLCAKYDPAYSMFSEDQSFRIAFAGILWAASMIFMLIGLKKLLSQTSENH